MEAATIRLKARTKITLSVELSPASIVFYEIDSEGEVFLGDNYDLYWEPEDKRWQFPMRYVDVELIADIHPMIIWAAFRALGYERKAIYMHFNSNWVELDFVRHLLEDLIVNSTENSHNE